MAHKVYPPYFHRLIRTCAFQAIGLALIYILIACLISLSKHWSYNTYAFDLGIFSQSLWYTMKGNVLYNSPEGMSHFGYHFQPILLLLLPIFRIAPYSETLLVIQSIALGGSGYLIYRLAATLGLEHKMALLVEVFFLSSPLVHGVNFYDFHPVALAVPTLLVMILGLRGRRWVVFGVGLTLSLMTKEDVIVALAVFGGVMLLAQYLKGNRLRKAYLAIFLSSLAMGITAMVVAKIASGQDIPPMLRCITERWPYQDRPFDIATAEAFGNFFSLESIFLFLSYFLPLAFLPLLSPLWISPVLFNVGKDMLAAYEGQKQLIQYTAPAIPFLFAALIETLRARLSLWITKGKKWLLIAIVVMSFSLSLLFDFIHLPQGVTFGAPAMPGVHEAATTRIISFIPDGVTVTVPNHIFPHLCTRTYTYLPDGPGDGKLNSEYAIIDLQNMDSYQDKASGRSINWERHFSTEYGVILRLDDVILLKRGN